VILGPKGIPYAGQRVSSLTQAAMPVPPMMFEDGSGLMALHNQNYDFSAGHTGVEKAV
jgi:hypothetical protein